MDALDLIAKIKMDLSEYEEGLDKAKSSAEKSGSGIGSVFGKVASVGGKALVGLTKATAVAVGAAATGVGALVTKSVKAYADYEQLVGGVQKLYGNMGMSLEDYAASVGKAVADVEGEYNNLEKAQNMVMNNAKNAFKTTGMSANEYMDIATSFSASLINSLGGDTVAAAKQTDVAMRAISDNFNTFGGDIGMIQGAFQGFAKANYTMLDNLKLGYGGTKEEMERLIADANEYGKATGQASNLTINSFSDIVTAIDLIQQKQNIAGTTAREATNTIAGSLGMLSSAWENLVTGISDKNANLDSLIKDVMDSLVGYTTVGTNGVKEHVNGFLDNLIPVIETALSSVATLVQNIVPKALDLLPTLFSNVLPKLITAGMNLVTGLATAIQDNLGTLVEIINKFAPQLITAFLEIIPQLIEVAGSIITALAEAIGANSEQIATGVVTVIDTFVTTILELLPTLLEVGLQIITQLMLGIAEALPEMVPTIVDVVLQITEILLDNLPMILDAAFQIMIALAQGIMNSLPKIAEKAPQIITSLVNAIFSSLGLLMQASVKMMTTLAEGILQNLPKIVDGAGKTVTAFIDAIIKGIDQIGRVGMDLIIGLWNGIASKKDWIIQQLNALGQSLIGAVKNIFGIASPSKVFAEIGGYLAEGLGEGWEDGINDVNKQIDKELHYKGDIDVTAKTNFAGVGTIQNNAKTLSDSDIDRLLSNLSINLTNVTEYKGDVIQQDTYNYTVRRIGNEARAVKIAMGGY